MSQNMFKIICMIVFLTSRKQQPHLIAITWHRNFVEFTMHKLT